MVLTATPFGMPATITLLTVAVGNNAASTVQERRPASRPSGRDQDFDNVVWALSRAAPGSFV